MAILKPTDFIKQIFIDQVGTISQTNHYIAFMVMSSGIEFLGKCLDTQSTDWHINSNGQGSKKIFESAIQKLHSLQKYEPFLDKYELYDSLRCGLIHAASTKNMITLSSGNEKAHLELDNAGTTLNLKCEDFYTDFKLACEDIINRQFGLFDKMNRDFIQIPGSLFDERTNITTGVTQSLQVQIP